ncbi:MAG: sigma-70 family RNA polymerase sigma factor [Anaerolineales bacterium]|jgi:RNA polymerase sigma factor (sigma-70 family)
MAYSENHLIEKIEEVLNSITSERDSQLVSKVKPIIHSNYDRGRLQAFIEGKDDFIEDYVKRVIENYSRLSSYLHQLQIERDDDVWRELLDQMQSWAYSYFLRKNFVPGEDTLEIAKTQATEAAITILDAHFPYDVEFSPWARVLLIHTCQRYIRKAIRKSEIPSKKVVSIDLVSELTGSLEKNPELSGEVKLDIIKAIEELPEVRRQVIVMLYFEGKTPKEISLSLKKSVGAIYSLHFNALNELRKILM